jgi:lipopolysaccharide export LptBFGC system permease protein LptF
MKILDRYVLRTFLYNYVISFLVLIGMYIVMDMVFNFDELVETRTRAQLSTFDIVRGIADYYFYQTFFIFAHLSGVIPVVAAAFTLIRLSRFNELSAILSAGVPLLRVAAPIIIATVVLQFLLLIDHEKVIPNIIPKLVRQHDEIYKKSGGKQFPVQAMQDENGLLFAGRYVPAGPNSPATLHVVDIIERDKELQPVAHTTAERAEWDAKKQQWNLATGRRVTGLRADEPRSEGKVVAHYKSSITPDEIELHHSGEYINLLSRERINQLLNRTRVYGAIDLLRVKHFRLSQLVMNVVMMLLAIPCVLVRDPKELKSSIFKCVILVGLAMAGYFIAFQVAGFPRGGPTWADRWPAIMAFVPILLFGIVAMLLLDRKANRDT